MKLQHYAYAFNSVSRLAAAIALTMMLTGCKEANLAIDFMLGTRSPAIFASHTMSPLSGFLLRKRATEERIHLVAEAAPKPLGDRTNHAQPATDEREKKESRPDSPRNQQVNQPNAMVGRDTLSFPRDPFRAPEEGRPAECPPSMPLCRFDRSELRLRGLIRVGDGQFKGMVEDPDGRGYFVTPGMQISGATVTQVTSRGITLFMHKSKKIDWMFLEGRDTKEN